MIRVVQCSSWIGIPDPDFLPIPDPGSKGQKCTGSRNRIRNTGKMASKISTVPYKFIFGNIKGRIRIRICKEREDLNPHKDNANTPVSEHEPAQFLRHKDCLQHESVNVHIAVAAEVVLPLANLILIENTWLKCYKKTPVFLTIFSEP
jgi:hypothetical protein